MSQHKLLPDELKIFEQIRKIELEKELKQLKAELDTANPLEAKKIQKIQEKMVKTKELLNNKDLLHEQILKETADQENVESIRKKIKQGVKKIEEKDKKLNSFFPDIKKAIHEDILNFPDGVYRLLPGVIAQNQESKGQEISRRTQKFLAKYHPIFKESYEDHGKIQPTNLKHSKEIESVLVKFLEIFEHRTQSKSKTTKECLDEAVSSVVEEYNKKHKENYSIEKFKYEFLSEEPMQSVIREIEGPDPYLLYELNLRLTHITNKLEKSEFTGGYDTDLELTKSDQKAFLTGIKEMYEKVEPKMSLKDCKTAVIRNLADQFIDKSKHKEYEDKVFDANERINKILESKEMLKLMKKIDEAPTKKLHRYGSEVTGTRDYSSISSETSSESTTLTKNSPTHKAKK